MTSRARKYAPLLGKGLLAFVPGALVYVGLRDVAPLAALLLFWALSVLFAEALFREGV